jgi:hypothetical protein
MQSAFDKARCKPRHNRRLADVKIELIAKHASQNADGEPRSEALASNGHPVPAKVKIMSLEDRSGDEPSADARIILHGDLWGKLSAPMQVSILNTYLTRIQVQLDEDGSPKLDDVGRPKLTKKPWEFQICGFHDVAKEDGKHSLEVHNIRVLFDKHGQTYLPWLDDNERAAPIFEVASKRVSHKAVTAGDGKHKRGSLAAKPLREHIMRIDKPDTLLAVAKLELENRPRKGVIAAIEDRVRELRLLPDYIAVTKNEKASVELDMAAAVLLTSTPKIDTGSLDSLVPDCRDVKVLGWILDDEGNDDPRDHVLEVVNRRIRELGK